MKQSNFNLKFNNQQYKISPIIGAVLMLIMLTPIIISMIGLYKYGGILLIFLGLILTTSFTITKNKNKTTTYTIINHSGTRFVIMIGFILFGFYSYFFS